ncbi:MAG: glycosyltransferase family 39 protein [Acidobacteriaceae bacterium]|jgi:4-amino-4-deoxy-L-arabinose transferase-like glycosyltransferase
MSTIASAEPATTPHAAAQSRHARVLSLLTALWLILFFASLFAPPVLDDADGTHANAARQMALSGDWVTLRVNNVRYLEKAPLPYWIVAVSLRLVGVNAFAAHLTQALCVLLLMLLGVRWARQSFGERAALYTGLGVLTSAGVFLFTRVFIPDVLLSLLLAAALYCLLQSLAPAQQMKPACSNGATQIDEVVILSAAKNPRISTGAQNYSVIPTGAQRSGGIPAFVFFRSTTNLYPYALWTALALAVLTKGLVAIVFLFAIAILFLALTGELRNWRRLKPFTGALLFLAIAAPWHILAGLRNTGGLNGHGFFWFYFINEHVLRFLGRRIPRDYNKLPSTLYWSLHLVWLFPWALFLPLGITGLHRRLLKLGQANPEKLTFASPWIIGATGLLLVGFFGTHYGLFVFLIFAVLVWDSTRGSNWRNRRPLTGLNCAQRTILLLTLFSALVLLFFSLSTNQEYYTFPAYLPLLMLLAASLARAEQTSNLEPRTSNPALTFAHAAFTAIGLSVAAALAYGLYTSRHLAFVPDIGELLAHRGVGDYTLSMSSLFDLTGPGFAALRLPASLALAAFALGPAVAWAFRAKLLRTRDRHLAATTTIALTAAVFLIAAHIALVRFAPMLSSQDFAARIQQLESSGAISRDNTLLLYGDQAYGSSIPFYLNRPLDRPALLVDGRSSSMLFGSTFPDAQGLFLTPAQLLAQWGTGPRKILFVPLERRDEVDRLLGPRAILLKETSGKALLTDRPLYVDSVRPLETNLTPQKDQPPQP